MTASDALAWMESMADGDRVLFRGQNRVWPSIKPSITRLSSSVQQMLWPICQRFHWAAATGLTGYLIPNEHDRLAILQHYIGRSPVIDLTATPKIALYFAILNANTSCESVVYSIDRSASNTANAVFSGHAFLALPLKDGGLQHRWIKQDGYSVGPSKWSDKTVVDAFDLLKLPGVQSKTFVVSDTDQDLVKHLGDLEDVSSDPLALSVRGMFTATAESLNLLTPEIKELLQSTKTRDWRAELATEIDDLIALAGAVEADQLIAELKKLRSSIQYWDISFEASLDWARQEVTRLTSKNI